MLTHLEFIIVKYALKVELYCLNLALPWTPTEVMGCEIFEFQSKKSFSSKTCLMTFRSMNGSEHKGQEKAMNKNLCGYRFL